MALTPDADLSRALERLPEQQRAYLRALLTESEVPARVRHALQVALSEDDLEILELTPALREQWNVPPREQAIASTADEPYRVFRQGDVPLFDAQSALKTTFSRRYGIAVSNRPITEKSNDLLRLVHELAHVAFEIEFRGRIKSFVNSLPRSLAYVDQNGLPWINEDFYTFLTEQYAHELEFLALRYSHRRHFEPWLEKYAWADGNVSKEEAFKKIASHILSVYEIQDPMVKSLSKLPLEILFSSKVDLAFQLERIRNSFPFLFSLSDSREFELGIALARLSEGDQSALAEANEAFQSWINRGLGGRRFTQVIENILTSLHQSGRAPSVLIGFLNQAPIRRVLVARGRWQLPSHFVVHVEGFLSAIPR